MGQAKSALYFDMIINFGSIYYVTQWTPLPSFLCKPKIGCIGYLGFISKARIGLNRFKCSLGLSKVDILSSEIALAPFSSFRKSFLKVVFLLNF